MNPLMERDPISGLMWTLIRPSSPSSVVVLIGRRLRPSSRPARPSLRYQSQISATVKLARAARRCADGSSPLHTSASFCRPRSRAWSVARMPCLPMTRRRVLPSALRYWTKYVFEPVGLTRIPKPRISPSQAKTSRSGRGLRLSTLALGQSRHVKSPICFPDSNLVWRGSAGEAVGGKSGGASGK